MSCNFTINCLPHCEPLVQESNYTPQAKSNMPFGFVNKVLLKTATLISLHITYSCIHAIPANLSNWDKDHNDPQSLKYFLSGPLQKSLPTPTWMYLTLVGSPCPTAETPYPLGWHLGPDLLCQVTFHFSLPWSLCFNQASPISFLLLADKMFSSSLLPNSQ